MNARSVTRRRTHGGVLRNAGWLSAAGLLALAALAPAAQAASVTPQPVSDQKNPTCSDFGAGWSEFKLEGAQLADGTYSNGTLTITISDYSNSSSGTPGSFDWAANIGVDAVLVKAGSDKHNLYIYDPESLGDTDLGPQAGTGNGISHLSFCYDVSAPPSTPPSNPPSTPPSNPPSNPPSTPPSTPPSNPPSTPPSTPPSNPPSTPPSTPPSNPPSTPPSNPPSTPPNTPSEAPATGDPSEPPATGDPSEAPSGEVEGISGTPATTLPPTDTIGQAGTSHDSWRIIVAGFAGLIAGLLLLSQPTRSRRAR